MTDDFLFRLSELQYLEPPRPRCPICGSKEIFDGVCRNCEYTEEELKAYDFDRKG